jgi:hypothetical protein
MTKKRIKKLADFFYSSDNSEDVPIRIMASSGQFSGFDFSKKGLIELLEILNKSENLKEDLLNFRNEYGQ